MSEFQNRLTAKQNTKKLNVIAYETDEGGELAELLVNVERYDGSVSKEGTKVDAYEFTPIINAKINGLGESRYSINKHDIYWVQSDVVDSQYVSISSNRGCRLYIDVIPSGTYDFCEINSISSGNIYSGVSFSSKTPGTGHEDFSISVAEYTVNIYEDANKSNKKGTETIRIHYMYLSDMNRIGHLARTVGTVFYITSVSTDRINAESNTSFPIRVEAANVNEHLDVTIENNNSIVVTVAIKAKEGNTDTSAGYSQWIEIYAGDTNTLIKRVEFWVVHEAESTDPRD